MTPYKAATVLAAMTGFICLMPVNAQAFTVAQPTLERSTGAALTPVRYRGHRHHGWRHRHHHRHHFGRDLAIGLGLGLLGAVASQAPAYDDARSLCASRFKSFEWDTGLYTTYGGNKRLCPYLR
jgi:BA14K-like protein